VAQVQAALPFELESPTAEQSLEPEVDSAGAIETEIIRESPAGLLPKPRGERYEISLHDATARGAKVDTTFHGLAKYPGSDAPLPVAALSTRAFAGLLDAGLLLFSYGAMLALFTALGGELAFNRVDTAVVAATLALFYAQYFALFTVFGGSTPGMMLRGIRVVNLEGNIPSSRQMMWRSGGYLVSAASCFLGFFWALWDDQHLCWHDRMSQTYLTPADKDT
jgi:uncharacterized RDD family membrane protein YckC